MPWGSGKAKAAALYGTYRSIQGSHPKLVCCPEDYSPELWTEEEFHFSRKEDPGRFWNVLSPGKPDGRPIQGTPTELKFFSERG